MMGQGVTVQGWKVRILSHGTTKNLGFFLPLAAWRDARV